MIGRLRGIVAAKGPGGVLVDVGGVGYDVATTPRAIAELPSVGEEAVLHTHLHVREDALAVFGFPTQRERDLFRLLLGASGVGPKVALAICATLLPAEVERAVMADDVDTLQLVPGIGKRSAQKLILELRPRLALPDGDLPGGGGSALAEVREALEALGYQPAEIKTTIAGLDGTEPVEVLVREALRRLGGG